MCFPSCCTAAAGSSSDQDAPVKSHYEQLLLGLQQDLEKQKDQVSKAQQDLRMQREQVEAFGVQPLIFTATSVQN